MRVIAGKAKGQRLKSASSAKVRPSGDRLKEAMFSTIGERVVGTRVLDLFAGSGALGIEALSRGAEHATFVESYPQAAGTIEANLHATGLSEKASVIRSTAEHFAASARGETFDLVFIDPPYALGVPFALLERLIEAGVVGKQSLVVLETSSRLREKAVPEPYRVQSERRYGDSMLTYLTAAEGSG